MLNKRLVLRASNTDGTLPPRNLRPEKNNHLHKTWHNQDLAYSARDKKTLENPHNIEKRQMISIKNPQPQQQQQPIND